MESWVVRVQMDGCMYSIAVYIWILVPYCILIFEMGAPQSLKLGV